MTEVGQTATTVEDSTLTIIQARHEARKDRTLMTVPEIQAYKAGYDANEDAGDFKDWG